MPLGQAIRQAQDLPRTPVTLKQLMAASKGSPEQVLPSTANFLVRELPIRFAYQIDLLERLPRGLCLMPSVRQVRKWYAESFDDLLGFGTVDSDSIERFSKTLRSIRDRHAATNMAIARGARELLNELQRDQLQKIDASEFPELHAAIDHFHASRIGILVLMDQHLALAEGLSGDTVGIINRHTSPRTVVKHAIEDAAFLCEQNYNNAPEVEIRGTTSHVFHYIPSHIYYIMFELLKNSMRATVETHQKAKVLPPIIVTIADGPNNQDVAIKVSDEGGGISRLQLERIWSYFYTTAPLRDATSSADLQRDWAVKGAPLAGLGYGLPLSRQYARYFGGDLQLLSLEGYGTDAFLHLSRLGTTLEKYGVSDV